MTENNPPLLAKIASRMPTALELDPNKEYYWCSCGESQNQPFCDGSHRGTGFTPVAFKPKDKHTVWLCNCKRSKRGHICDGAHNKLKP